MALIPAESKIPALCLAHLIARRNDADNPTPAANALTLVAGPVKTTARSHPSLEVWVASVNFPTRRDEEVCEVHMDLHLSEDTSITVATELAQFASILRSFTGGPISKQSNAADANTNPFHTYLNALDDTASAGWKIDDFHLTARATLIADNRRILRATYQCKYRSYVQTV
jgi:hypothetical protein